MQYLLSIPVLAVLDMSLVGGLLVRSIQDNGLTVRAACDAYSYCSVWSARKKTNIVEHIFTTQTAWVFNICGESCDELSRARVLVVQYNCVLE